MAIVLVGWALLVPLRSLGQEAARSAAPVLFDTRDLKGLETLAAQDARGAAAPTVYLPEKDEKGTRSGTVRGAPVLPGMGSPSGLEARRQAAHARREAAAAAVPAAVSQAVDPAAVHAVRQARWGEGYGPIQTGVVRRVAFGHTKPVLKLPPVGGGVIRLQEGEVVYGVGPGDSENWQFRPAYAGPGGSTPLVFVKATSPHARPSNAFIFTDRRIYEVIVELDEDAPSSPDALSEATVLAFYYPDDVVQLWQQVQGNTAPSSALALSPALADGRAGASYAGQGASSAPAPSAGDAYGNAGWADPATYNFDYEWERGKYFPWEPAAVYDDGAVTYIKLPLEARYEPLAALLVVGPGGEASLANTTPDGDVIRLDRVADEVVLIAANPSKKKQNDRQLRITNTRRVSPESLARTPRSSWRRR